ncbi:MAG: hypothetical protein ACLUAR_16890 [Pilosibacter sp.]
MCLIRPKNKEEMLTVSESGNLSMRSIGRDS